jgi:hypothetical protein
VDAGEVHGHPHREAEHQVGRPAPHREVAQPDHERQPEHGQRQRRQREVLGVEERDHGERPDVVGDGQGEQEQPQLRRAGRPDQREHAEQERGVGGDHHAPRRGRLVAEVNAT